MAGSQRPNISSWVNQSLSVKMEKGIFSRAEKRKPYTRKFALWNILNQRCRQWDIQDSEYPNGYLYASAPNTDEFYMAHSWSQCPVISPIMYSHKIRQFDPLRGLSWSLRNYYVISSWPFDPLVAHYYETFQSSKPTTQTPLLFYMITEKHAWKSQFLSLSHWTDCVSMCCMKQTQTRIRSSIPAAGYSFRAIPGSFDFRNERLSCSYCL